MPRLIFVLKCLSTVGILAITGFSNMPTNKKILLVALLIINTVLNIYYGGIK